MVNKATLNLIKSFEGLELKAYYDSVKVLTIGYGHTNMAGSPKIIPGMVITEQEAENILANDLKKYEAMVSRNVKVSLNENQFGALTSFVYNLGEGNFKASTLLKRVNTEDFKGAAQEFKKWNKAGGEILKGLTRRREAEANLFSLPPTEPVQPVSNNPGVVVLKCPICSQELSLTDCEALKNMKGN